MTLKTDYKNYCNKWRKPKSQQRVGVTLKFKIMDLKKKSFDKLVEKMDILQENQQGSLKGGFSSVSSNARAVDADGNIFILFKT